MPDPNDIPVPDAVELRFDDMAYGGDAVGRANGIAVFAWPGIKGEDARVEITTRRPNLLRGRVAEVLRASSLRTAAPCPYFGACGGCQWQHIEYEGQVGFKNEILRSQLERLGGIADASAVLTTPIPSPLPFNYRNTSHFALGPDSHSLGYYERDSHTVVPVAECPISNAGINAAIPLVNEVLRLASAGAQEMDESRGVMRVWQITIRASERTGQTLLVFHTRVGGRAKPRKGRREARAQSPSRPEEGPGRHPSIQEAGDVPLLRKQIRRLIYDVVQQSNSPNMALTSVEVMEDGTVNMLGQTRSASRLFADAQAESLTGSILRGEGSTQERAEPPLGAWVEQLGGHTFWVAPTAFFQANTAVAESMLDQVLALAPSSASLAVDAHAGVGTFAIALANRAGKVIGFETDSAAVASARWTAAVSRMSNVEYRHGAAEVLLARLRPSEQPELVILDPPRTGCHRSLLDELSRRRVPAVIYVSCDPSTLARDLKVLSPSYEIAGARMFDMFPQTFHIETVVALKSRS